LIHFYKRPITMASQAEDRDDSVLDPILEELCKPIKDLKVNFEVKISEYLSMYMNELHAKFEENGQTLNFSQAAMILQGTVGCYSKKVDFLHDYSLKMLNMIGKDKGGEDGSQGESRVGGRRRKEDIVQEFSFLAIERGKNIDKKNQESDIKILEQKLGFVHPTPRELIEKEGHDPSLMKVDLYYGHNFELLGAKKDFRMNSQFSSATCTFGERLYVSEAPAENVLDVTVENVNYHPEHNDFNESSEPVGDLGADLDLDVDPLPPISPQPIPVNQDEPRIECEDDHGDIEMNDHGDTHLDHLDVSERAMGQRPLDRLRERIVDLPNTPPKVVEPDVDPWEALNPFDKSGLIKVPRRVKITILPPSIIQKHKAEKSKKPVEMKTFPPISQFLKNDKDCNLVEEVGGELKAYIEDEAERRRLFIKNKKNGKKPRPMSKRLVDTEEVPLEDFIFESEHQIAEGVDDDDGGDDEDFEPLPAFQFPDAHLGGEIGPAFDISERSLPDGVEGASQASGGRTYEEMVTQVIKEFVQKSQAWAASSDMARKVNAWHEMIGPRLENVEKRAAFDIHKYGSVILNSFPADDRKTTKKFSDVVRNCSREDTSRYFLASLMLANCLNVEIGSAGVMDDMEMRFLTTRRHHEELQEFQAASQQNRDSLNASQSQSGSQSKRRN